MQALTRRAKSALPRPTSAPPEARCFAQNGNRYQLFWICLIISFFGCMTETVFMLLTRGELQNRSGVLFGQFSLVWGLGAVLFTLCFRPLRHRSRILILLLGTVLGAGYEYACSWIQEVLFGACFWDYSHLPFNLNGRVNLVFSLFWGVAAVLWVRNGYPAVGRLIGRIPSEIGRPLTQCLAVFMVANILITGAALGRMDGRGKELPPANAVEVFLDRYFTDQRLKQNFSTLVYVGSTQARMAAGMSQARDLPGE